MGLQNLNLKRQLATLGANICIDIAYSQSQCSEHVCTQIFSAFARSPAVHRSNSTSATLTTTAFHITLITASHIVLSIFLSLSPSLLRPVVVVVIVCLSSSSIPSISNSSRPVFFFSNGLHHLYSSTTTTALSAFDVLRRVCAEPSCHPLDHEACHRHATLIVIFIVSTCDRGGIKKG